MGFRNGAYAKIWETDVKEKYTVASVSISKKNKQTNQYETDFSSKFVRLIGGAHAFVKNANIPSNGLSVKIKECEVTNKYDKETKKEYTNFLIYAFEEDESESKPEPKKSKNVTGKEDFMQIPDGLDEELPFC